MNHHPDTQPRWLALDGPVNFRDLGGYRSSDGRSVREGLVYRADSLHTMSDVDVDRIVREAGVSTVVDLRTAGEVELIGVGPIRDAGIRWHNVSIFDETQRGASGATADHALGRTMAQEYLDMLEHTGRQFASVIEIVAKAERPLVFHCAAGKDRTGLVAALLLDLLGVGDDDIAADYALTQRVMPTLQERFLDRVRNPKFASLYGDRSQWEPRMNKAMASAPETIHEVLTRLRERHGAVEAWLLAGGLSPAVPGVLRNRLLA